MNKRVLILALMLLPISTIFAQSNAPNSPEAASFEPIDATDMVNLATGDFTYVLPVMNVPSPEGGYPIALSYHAGIAMDQEASWAGLGWNLNPGAINRNVNGYPDDYNHSVLSEYFYDAGGTQTYYSASLGVAAGGLTIGANLSWGGNRGLGGAISIGYGPAHGLGGNISIGTNGVSGGLGYNFASGLSLGVSASSNGTVGISGGVINTNGSGWSIGASTAGTYSAGFRTSSGNSNLVSMSVSFSSSGVGISGGIRNRGASNNVLSGGGIGLNVSFNNSVSMGDYTTRSSGFTIPVMVPIGPVIITASFGKQEIRYALGKNEKNYINGPINFHNGTMDSYTYMVECRQNLYQGANSDDSCGSYGIFNTLQEAEDVRDDLMADMDGIDRDCNCYIDQIGSTESFMDMYAIPIDNNEISESVDLTANNLTFPNYDNYNIQAQGLSGSMSAPLYDNGALFGLSDKKFKDASDTEYTTNYLVNGGSGSLPAHTKFTQQPDFYMRNEISTYLGFADVGSANFFNNGSSSNILQNYLSGVEQSHKPRRKTPNHIEYYTNTEIVNNPNGIKSEGYLKPNVDGMSLDRSSLPQDGIGAFKITAADGKTYHYSLPVYNHETVIRTLGAIKDNNGNPKDEDESYFEKRQLESYATHWLLTAVTGPDFIDRNNDGVANEGDYGYWTSFSYGKWSDSWVWKTPVKEDYLISTEESGIKTKVNGRKELYYLNTIKTRTHTALFVKERDQILQEGWDYSSVLHRQGAIQNSSNFVSRFNIPSQRKLYLSKVILLKNEALNNINLFGSNQQSTPLVLGYNYSSKSSINSYYNAEGNVLTGSDLNSYTSLPTLKTVELTQQFSNTAGSKRELTKVNFKGKGGADVIPPYQFSYYNSNRSFNIKDKDEWGYSKYGAQFWSLRQIKTPEGGIINVDYENHQLKAVIDHDFKFTNYTQGTFKSTYPVFTSLQDRFNKKIVISSSTPLTLVINSKVNVNYEGIYPPVNGKFIDATYSGLGTIKRYLGNNSYEVEFDNPVNLAGTFNNCNVSAVESNLNLNRADWANTGVSAKEYFEKFYRLTEVSFTSAGKVLEQGGIRASKVSVTDGIKEYATTYSYGENSDGVGYVSYLPYAPELEKEMPYSSELPAPKPMYDYVSVESKDTNVISHGRTEYHFNVLTEKSPNDIKFGDFYEIDVDYSNESNHANNNKKVNIAKYTVQDNLASVGQLLSVASYNVKGQMLSKTENEYYAAGQTPNQYGMTKQAFQTYKEVDFEDNTTLQDKWIINSSSRITYPSLLRSTKSVSGGYTFESEFTQFNPDTGQSDEIISEDSKGKRFKTESIPAYKIYAGMGSKVDNVNNKNMLSQQAMSKSYIDQNGTWKLTGAGITTWNNDWRYFTSSGSYEPTTTNPTQKIWRKHKTYVWDGILNTDGTYQNFTGDYDNFNWGLGGYVSIGNGLVEHRSSHPSSSDWKEVSHITTYNHYSMPLEVKDINGNYASTKTDKNHEKVIATSNAAYTEQFYSGAEDQANGWVGGQIGIWYHQDTRAHTGRYSENAGGNSKNFKCYPIPRLQPGQASKKFKVSVWASKDNHSNARIYVEGQGLQSFNGEIIPAGEWVQLNHYFDLSEKKEVYVTSASGAIYFDDFKLHPMASSSTSYVYNESDELTYILGANNLATKYEYDDAGRLVRVYNEIVDNGSIEGGFKLVKQMKYNYKSDVTVSTPAAPRNPVRIRNIEGSGINACVPEVIAPVGQTAPNMQYRWAQGASPNNLVLGPWTSDLCMELVLEPCRNTFYKIVVRNATNGVTREWTGSHFNREGCPPRDVGNESPVIDDGRRSTIRSN